MTSTKAINLRGGYEKGISEWLADGTQANAAQPLSLEPLIGNGEPWRLTLDDDGYIYFSDIDTL